MSNIKIIFFDIDGTLIDMKRKLISANTLYTLKRLKENKIIICLATGRSPIVLPNFNEIEFDAFLTYNGSYCYNQKDIIFSNPLSNDDVSTIINNAAQINRPLSLATKDRMAANGKDDDLIKYYGFANHNVDVADDFNDVAKEEIFQILIGCRKEDHPLLLKNVRNAKITFWWDNAADIIPATGGKGLGIQKVLEYYNLDKSEAMAFGDGNNDIEMLKAVGTGVAMGNASDDLKKAATNICGSTADDGIYHYCIEKHLI